MGPVVPSHRTYNFSQIMASWDYQLGLGLTPIVELSFMPAVLANCSWNGVNPTAPKCAHTMMAYHGITAEPTDYDDWYHLVRALVQAATARYGGAELRRWSFECWNELWGMPFPSAYMKLYNASTAAVKSVDKSYLVGGPATAQLEGPQGNVSGFVHEATARGLPFDFVSTHFYPSSGPRTAFRPCAGGDRWDPGCFGQQMRATRAAIPASVPFYLTEYNSGCCIGYFQHDTAGSAAFALRAVTEAAGVADVLSWWTFTDIFEEGGLPKTEFSNIYGAMTFHGIPKPVWRAFELLHSHAGSRQVPAVVSGPANSNASLVTAFATVNGTGAAEQPVVFLSFWENGGPPEYQIDRTVTVTAKGRNGMAAASGTVYRIDYDHANPLKAWQAMGSPANPTAAQLEQLGQASRVMPEVMAVSTTGSCTLTLPPNSAAVLVFGGDAAWQQPGSS